MKRVLIVDDANTVRMYHRQLMEQSGYQVEEAENGIEALEKALSTPPDLALVDVNMPKMDGYRLIEEMRRSEELRAIPVIMISTEEEATDREKAYLAGANFYQVKPVQPEQLQTCVNLILGG